MTSITELLSKSTRGNEGETDKLFTLMYDDLCRMAGRFLQNEPMRNRLSSSSLVHQAYVRMVDQSRINWQGKTHFFAIGATVMRRILVDHARKVRSLKRGGGWERRQLNDEITFLLSDDGDVMALDELLETLAELNPRQAKIVELRFFGGMTMREISTEMNLGLRTIEKEWAMARAWMRRELRREELAESNGTNQTTFGSNDEDIEEDPHATWTEGE
ncbi:sigma-70 family RNA polymerase sigma factor [Rubripirellula amarantea]|uniref:RNA polymerase sigma factor n=1 Tax=Rubripirellula amarantea TaxID=2527999 RepID=A0A5C5WJU3_9BACT|nr:sigma-70 family RNA polymerase sigma factor [Rubripirellula amarantea]MDA8743962.1 sigma-70 family RNA polymerase sigma factor [Rubripirellula amarantea]TWT50281.1 RNA polymerase sigma factor [Rubripirellula amarantea]